jgi:hypothetical protein
VWAGRQPLAQADDGALVWLYRCRLPAVQGAVTWFVQGMFA